MRGGDGVVPDPPPPWVKKNRCRAPENFSEGLQSAQSAFSGDLFSNLTKTAVKNICLPAPSAGAESIFVQWGSLTSRWSVYKTTFNTLGKGARVDALAWGRLVLVLFGNDKKPSLVHFVQPTPHHMLAKQLCGAAALTKTGRNLPDPFYRGLSSLDEDSVWLVHNRLKPITLFFG